MVTSHDVARLAGVSQPTVSRALRGAAGISESTRGRVERAAKELGYVPSATGRALSVGRSRRIGLLVTDLENQFYKHVIAPIHHELSRLDYELILMTDEDGRTDVAQRVVANGVDGVVLATANLDSPVPHRLRARGTPFVYFNRTTDAVPADAVTVDPEPGLVAAVDAVVGLGHRRVGAIFGPKSASTGIRRSDVIQGALADRGVLLEPALRQFGEFDTESGRAGARRLMALPDPPTAIFCGNDVVALGAFNELVSLGYRVPQDVSVIGFDDLPEASWPVFDLSTVAFDLQGMARRAAVIITSRVEAESDGELVLDVFPSSFVRRGSLDVPSA